VKSPFKIFVSGSEFQHETGEILKLEDINTEMKGLKS